MNNLTDTEGILNNLGAIAVFKNIFNDNIISKFLLFLDSINQNPEISETV